MSVLLSSWGADAGVRSPGHRRTTMTAAVSLCLARRRNFLVIRSRREVPLIWPATQLSCHYPSSSSSSLLLLLHTCCRGNESWDETTKARLRHKPSSSDFQGPALSKVNRVAAVLTAKGRIAAATYRLTLALPGYSIYFTAAPEMPPKLLFSLIHVSLGPPHFIPQTASRSVQLF